MPSICESCESPLDGRRKSARYCSDACRQAGFRARKTQTQSARPVREARRAPEQPPPPPPQPPPVQVQVLREVVQVADPALEQRIAVLERELRKAQAKITTLEGAGPKVEDVRRLQREVAGLREWRKEAREALTEHEHRLTAVYHRISEVNTEIATLAKSVAEYAGSRSWFG